MSDHGGAPGFSDAVYLARQRRRAELAATVGPVDAVRIMDACTLAARRTVLSWENYHADAWRRVKEGQTAERILASITARARLSAKPDLLALYDHLCRTLGRFYHG